MLFCILLAEIVLDWLESRQNLPIPLLHPAGAMFNRLAAAMPPTAPTKPTRMQWSENENYFREKMITKSALPQNNYLKTSTPGDANSNLMLQKQKQPWRRSSA